MEGWVPASRIASLNKKNIKRLRETDNVFIDKVVFRRTSDPQKSPAEPSLLEKEQGELTKVYFFVIQNNVQIKRIETIELGSHEMSCWYYSPYPEAFQVPKLYICEYCLKYYTTASELDKHSQYCNYSHPPGMFLHISINRR